MKTIKKRPWFKLGLVAPMVIILLMVQPTPTKAMYMMSDGTAMAAYAEQTTAQSMDGPRDVGWTITNDMLVKNNPMMVDLMTGRLGDHDCDFLMNMEVDDHPSADLYYILSFGLHPQYAMIDDYTLNKFLEGESNTVIFKKSNYDLVVRTSTVVSERDVDRCTTSINNAFYSPANRTLRLYLLVPPPMRIAPAWRI